MRSCFTAWTHFKRQESKRPRERYGSPERIKTLKAKPHERYRDEISPERNCGV